MMMPDDHTGGDAADRREKALAWWEVWSKQPVILPDGTEKVNGDLTLGEVQALAEHKRIEAAELKREVAWLNRMAALKRLGA